MTSIRKKKFSISLLIPFLVFVFLFSIMIFQKYRSSQVITAAPSPLNTEGRRSITLFFDAENSGLIREPREIEPCGNVDSCLKRVLEELLNGPIGDLEETVPDGTVVNTVQVNANQATIEFNRIFFDSMPSGSYAEMLAVYSVVNTVVANFPQIQKVKINIDGNSAAILRHLDLSEPLLPDYTLERPDSLEHVKAPAGLTTNQKGDPR